MIADGLDAPSRSPEEIERLTAAAIDAADARIEAAVAVAAPTFEELFGALDDAARTVAVASGQGAFLKSVDPDDAVRAAADAADERIAKWRAGVSGRADVAAAIARFAASVEPEALDEEERAYVRRWQLDVRQSGADLPPAARAEVARLVDRLIELQTTFAANLIVTEHIELRRDQLAGVPDAIVRTLEPGSAPDTVDTPINEAVSIGILERAHDRAARERVVRARLNRGMPGNLPILEEAVVLRRRLARLLGYRSWLELRVENLAAPDAATIEGFVDDMVHRLEPIAHAELEAMRALLAAEPDAPDDLVVEDWDWRYAEAAQRAAVGARPEELEGYLELETVLGGLMTLSERVFGIRMVERPERRGWHPTVRAFDLLDRDTGGLVARLLFDPYVREGKAGNPFMDVLDPGVRRAAGVVRPPTLALIISAPEPSDGPSLIGTNDVEALFHEYGHCLDFALEPSRFAVNRPDVWIQSDWIEGPSGFLGRWGRHPAVIAEFARHHETGAPIPADLLEPMERVEALNVALRQLRFLSMAKLDLLIHGEEPITVAEALRRTWPVRGTPYPEDTAEPAAIPHLLVGYDCAIYGFVWATALSDDLLSRFEADGMTSPELGMAYRRRILEVPWTADPLTAHAAFMGRPWTIDALLARVARGHS